MKHQPSRTIRVFLSSTFRDFAEERDLLVRKVFPELRRKCRERQVELIDVDLRWGITEEEAQQGKVLPICLAEIDRARPYFMGFIGERYGWVPAPEQYDPSILQEQPWLEEHRGGKSVTELEILHGVLNNPAMAGRAFFYFRDPKYSHTAGGCYLSEGPDENGKLNELKSRIRQSGFPIVDNYNNPEALAERVRTDLWSLCDEAFPVETVPDALAMERRRHEAYGASRLGMYLGGGKYFKTLDRATHKARGFVPAMISGDSGSGKSALVANWTQAHAASHPDCLLFVHYLGAGADAADPLRLVTRLLKEIARITGEELKLESDPQKILDLLPEWLVRASAFAEKHQTEWLLVFDGLDKLTSLRDLRWWPGFLPHGIKVVCSCLNGEVKDAALKQMTWTELGVFPLAKKDQSSFIKDYLARYRKSLTRPQSARVQAHPLSGNPLFLKTLLEELRIFGIHEQLDSKITHYLNSQSIDDLFERVLERVDHDAGKKPVRAAMEAIWASREGLAQDELLAITKMKPAVWAAIHNALDEALIETNGRISFGHDYLRKAVEDRYLLSPENRKKAHTRLAVWFGKQEVTPRTAEELPWQWQQSGENQKLKRCLITMEMFEALYERDEYELLGYWLTIKEYCLENEYEKAWKKWSSYESKLANMAVKLAGFLQIVGVYGGFTSILYIFALSIHGDDFDWLNLGELMTSQGDYKLAQELYRKALHASEKSLGQMHPETLFCMSSIGDSLAEFGRYEESEIFVRAALAGREEVLGLSHIDTLWSVMSLGNLLAFNGHDEEALKLYQRARSGFERLFPPGDPSIIACLNNMANVFGSICNYVKAEELYSTVLSIRKRTLGSQHPATLSTINNIGRTIFDKGEIYKAEQLYRQALEGYKATLGLKHPLALECLANLGRLLSQKKEYDEALEHYRVVLNRWKAIYGSGNIKTLTYTEEFAELLFSIRAYEEGANILKEATDQDFGMISYNRACFECKLDRLNDAKQCIANHVRLHPNCKATAYIDEDLFAIKDYIQNLNQLCL